MFSKNNSLDKVLEQEVKALKGFIIAQAIRSNKMIKEHTLYTDEVLINGLTKHFTVKMNGEIPMIKNVDNLISLENPARSASTDEAVTQLLQTTFKDHLLPEQEKRPPTPVADEKKPPQSPQVSGLLAQYNEAKLRSDGPSMISLKRRLHEAGHLII